MYTFDLFLLAIGDIVPYHRIVSLYVHFVISCCYNSVCGICSALVVSLKCYCCLGLKNNCFSYHNKQKCIQHYVLSICFVVLYGIIHKSRYSADVVLVMYSAHHTVL